MDYNHESMMNNDQIKALGHKRTNLLNPGSVEVDYYYSATNSRVNPIESVMQTGSYRVSLSSPTYGGMSTVQINNQNLVGKVYLTIGLPKPAGSGIADIALPRGWGYRLIRQLDVLVGNSNISTQTFHNTQTFHTMFGQCSGAQELDFYLEQGGSEILGSAYTGVAFPDYLFIDGYAYATVILDLPWSSWCNGVESKLYFDTSLLNQPITLNIKFADYADLFGSVYAPPSNERTLQATLYYSELVYSNKEQGIRDTLKRSPDMIISYPSIYKTPSSSDILLYPTTANGGAFSCNLQGFLDSDLLSISLSFHLQEELNNTAGPNNFYNCLDCYDLKLEFGGQVIDWYPANSFKLIQQQSGGMMPTYMTNVVARVISGDEKYGARQAYVIFLDLSRLRALCTVGMPVKAPFPNSCKVPNQILTLTGKIPESYYFVDQASALQEIPIWDKTVVLKGSFFYPQISTIDSKGNFNVWYS